MGSEQATKLVGVSIFLIRWFNPNVLTLAALLVNVIPCCLLVIFFGYEYDGPIDAWMSYMIGYSYMIYIFLDASDGKQARRIGASSPLGMLFDHGCDAVVAVINSTLMQRIFCCGTNPYHLFAMMIAIFPFYFVTMEQHYTGEMNFPEINGVDEGSVVIFTLAILSGIYGNANLWKAKVMLPYFNQEVEVHEILLKAVIAGIYPYALQCFY